MDTGGREGHQPERWTEILSNQSGGQRTCPTTGSDLPGHSSQIFHSFQTFHSSKIFLFDESLSAVDGTVGKNTLNDGINVCLKNKIRFLITGRVNHLESADNIIVMNNSLIEAQDD